MNNEPEVVVFSSPHCGKCHSLMDWMDKAEIKYTEKNLADETVQKDLQEKVGHEVVSAPFTLVGDEGVEGFDRKAILKALGR